MGEAQRKKYKADDALSRLRSEITSGRYGSGSFLPPERNLAESLGISRGTLRKILKDLHGESLLRVNPGKGAYVIYGREERKGLRRFLVRFPGVNPRDKATEAVGSLLGICSAASRLHAEALISFAPGDSSPSGIISAFSADDIQGVVFGETCDYKKEIMPLEKAGVPYVVMNLERDMSVVSARMDFREVGRCAGKYLTGLGHRRIAVLSGPLLSAGQSIIYKEMLAGFRGALAEEELFLDKELVVETLREDAKAGALALLRKSDDRPTAIFAMRDYRAEGVFAACAELGLKVPDDLSVVSYDNITWPSAASFGLTTIREQVEEMGDGAVEMLASWAATGKRPESRLFPGELILRSSVKPGK